VELTHGGTPSEVAAGADESESRQVSESFSNCLERQLRFPAEDRSGQSFAMSAAQAVSGL